MPTVSDPISIIVIGASGHLARNKLFPALFALYCQDLLPDNFHLFGMARTEFNHAEFRGRIAENLTCRYAAGESCADRMEEFLAHCYYIKGQYNSTDSFLDLYRVMRERETTATTNRIFYLAIPPSIFLDVARAIGDSGMVQCGVSETWSRVVIEKPFGRDRASSDELTLEMAKVFTEDQTYRIDHYLGKEVVQNIMVLRFANRVFEPIWNRNHIESVQIVWKEDLNVQGRGGYFDSYGIIRDVIQNHLLQILALMAMERPASLEEAAIRGAKVALLRQVAPVTADHIVVGQYTGSTINGQPHPGYREDETVPDDSVTPTFCASVLHIDSPRWKDVPFMIKAGKGLDSRINEIRIRFKSTDMAPFCSAENCPPPNELVIRIQPDESIFFTVTNKVPGHDMAMATRKLDLRYDSAFEEDIPDAYESLLLDVVRGEKSLFIRSDELAAAWDVFTPILHELEASRTVPEPYPFGSTGPVATEELAKLHDVAWEQ